MADQDFEVLPITEEDYEAVMELFRRTFFVDEPMNLAVGLCTEGTCTEVEDYCKSSLPEGLSFKAVDKDGNIIAAMANGICPLKEDDENGNDYLSLAQKCTNPKFQKILYVLARREDGARLWEKFPEDKQLVEVKAAATDPKWRRKGIMNVMLEETEKLTKRRGIRLLRMDCSSAYSAMVAERYGFTCMYSAPYTEIKLDGRPIVVPEPPHVDDRVYIKVLA